MKIKELKCPTCSAPLEINFEKPISYCPYCGTPVYVDDETQRIDIRYKSEQVIHDEARIKEAENRAKELKNRILEIFMAELAPWLSFIIFFIVVVLLMVIGIKLC